LKKFTTLSVSVLLIQLLSISPLAAQTVFSRTSDSLVVFYPAAYDPTQTQPSFIINNEPVVTAGKPAGWRISPVFTSVGGDAIATVNCGHVDFYGSGEVIGNLRRNNTTITLWNTDNYQYTTKNNGLQLYQTHPWMMGVRADGTAFGIIADNTWEMTLQTTDTSVIFNSQGPGFRVLIFEAANPAAVVKELALLTSKISLPPIWSLGYQQCRYSYTPDTQVEGVADSFRLLNLPCDVMWMDIDYMNQYEVFTFNSSTFPHPDSLNAYLHRKNFHSVWMIDPGVKQLAGYSVYDSIVLPANNYAVQLSGGGAYVGVVWPGNCVFPDFTMPSTRAWWSRRYKSFMALGMDGVWNDMNEPSVFSDNYGSSGTMPTTNLHAGGGGLPAGPHLRYHNVFGRLMVQATREGIEAANPTKRPFVLSRANILGGQQYAATWTGDNVATAAYMQLSVPMILTMGLSGQPIVGADVTGYSGSPTGDLVGQWMALGTFYPFYRNHSEKGTPRREPWAFGSAIQAVCQTALQRRYRLLPYLYTLTQEATTDGLPIMRALFMEDPTNAALRSQQQAFMLGDELLITPKWATGVVKPTGTWTSISLVGENSVTDAYQPNIEIKAGSILPLGQIVQSTADYTADSLTLIVSLDANDRATGSVYSDAGEGYAYQTGSYLMRSFNIKPSGTDSLMLTAVVDSGSLSTTTNRYNVGIVTAHSIVYTGWTNKNVIMIPKSLYGESAYPTVATIPGTIQAENYDKGGQAVAYNDADTTNNGAQYRLTEGVDIEACTDIGTGYDMGWTVAGEWEKYTVNVLTPGTYTLQARVASPNSNESFHVEMDGNNIGKVNVPNTGGYQTWQTVNVTTPVLTGGGKTMAIMVDSSGYNINYLTFVLSSFVSCPGAVDYLIATTPTAGNTYQWQVNTGSGYTNLANNATYANVTKDTLTFLNASSSLYGYQYRCAITNGATTYSTAYTLSFTDTWTGWESTAWEDPNNWSCGTIPDAHTDVIINSGVPNNPVVNSAAICRTLTANQSSSIEVSTNHSLTITH
jgi:alpha-glucosidase